MTIVRPARPDDACGREIVHLEARRDGAHVEPWMQSFIEREASAFRFDHA